MSEHFDSYQDEPQAQAAPTETVVQAAPLAEISLSPELTQTLTSELVQKLIEIERAKPELIKKLLAQRAEAAKAAKEAATKAKADANAADAQLLESLRALGWRRPRAAKDPAAPKPPAKKRGRKPKTKPAGEVAPAGTEN